MARIEKFGRGGNGGDHASSPLAMIRSSYGGFTPAERRIADVILEEPQRVVYASITELAALAGTAESSIIRFCRRVECRGYQELKLGLAQELANQREELTGPIVASDNVAELLAKVEQRHAHVLRDSHTVLDTVAFEHVVDRLCVAHRVLFFGAGESGIAALQAQFRFSRVGLPVIGVAETHLAAMQASLLQPDDLACAISASGSSKDTVESLALARERGAYCVAITGQARSPICEYADAVLLVAAREGPLSGTGFLATVGTGFVLDALQTAVIMRDEQKALYYAKRISAAVTHKLY